MTLTEFLTARLDEDESAAHQALSSTNLYDSAAEEVFERASNEGASVLGLAHAYRWMPKRVLSEVEAKRRIMAAALDVVYPEPGEDPYADTDIADDGQVWAFGLTLRLLALPYVDHPDYDEAWRP